MSSVEKDRKNGDPHHIGKRGKAASQRKGRYDGSFTPTEQRLKDKLMRQFIRGYDGPRGTSLEYINSPVWCTHPGCTLMNGSHSHFTELKEQTRKFLDEYAAKASAALKRVARR